MGQLSGDIPVSVAETENAAAVDAPSASGGFQSRFVPFDTDDRRVAGGPTPFRCGRCHTEVRAAHGVRNVRCGCCGIRLSVPGHVRVWCDRCGNSHRIRISQVNLERFCAVCSQPLFVPDQFLNPLRKHRWRRTTHRHGLSPHGNAVWTTLLVSAALLLSAVLLSRL
jgi:hypothetical protein